MGKGDKKTRRGKIIMGSYGVVRPRKIDKKVELPEKPKKAKVVIEDAVVKKAVVKKAVVKKAAAKKTTAKKTTETLD